jgi:uncharacterized DUF497 family protein
VAKHNVSFEEAASVFHDPRMMTLYDGRHSCNEDRWVTLGISTAGRLLLVCHTFVEESESVARIRGFSVRKATTQEKQQYEG